MLKSSCVPDFPLYTRFRLPNSQMSEVLVTYRSFALWRVEYKAAAMTHALLSFYFFQNVPPDLSVCGFVLAQCLSVRALQEMLAHSVHLAAEVGV